MNSVGVMFGLQKTIKLIIHNPYIDRAKERELYIIQFSIGNISLFHTTPIRGPFQGLLLHILSLENSAMYAVMKHWLDLTE